MKDTLLDLSGKIDELTLGLYEALNGAAVSGGVPFFLLGAAARDMILARGYGVPIKRATLVVDIGLRVADWQQFERLKQSLLDTNEFNATRDIKRILYREQIPVDIIPFGPVEGGTRAIKWPPDQAVTMSVAGFEEAYRSAQQVRLRVDPPLDIRVATLAGLALLKIIAWGDRRSDKDPRDLVHIMTTYLDAGNLDRLMEDHSDLLGNLDYVRAGARLLGRDIGHIAEADTKERIAAILGVETADRSHYELVRQMMLSSPLSEEEGEKSFEDNLTLLLELKRGIQES
jgi:predicted nucleotidyltransferase